MTAEEKEGEGGRRRKRRRGRKKERERRKRRKEEGRRGGVHSPTRFHYSICVSNHVHRSLSTPAAAATAFRAELRYSIFFFPHLPFFYFRPPLPPLLPPPPPPAPPSPPLIPPFVFFFPPTSAILCFRFLLVSRFRFLFTGSFPTSDIHVAYQSPVSSIVGLPRRCSATDLATMTAIHRQSNALVPRFATLGRRPACMLSMFRVCEDVNPHLHSFHPPRHHPRPPPSPPPSPLPLPLPAVHPQSMVRRVRYLPTLAARS